MYKLTVTALALVMATAASAQQGQPGGHFVDNWDQDGDGAVTLAEATERRDMVFGTFDANEDGFLDAEEYDLFDEARANDMADNGGHGAGMQRLGQGLMRDFNDTDGDGMVSKDEFLTRTGDWFAMIDTNGDGAVTTDDFGKP